MFNYDLPWNPMRLVQRIGRIYRYGQTRKVVVFNLQAEGSVDSYIIQLMYERIQGIVKDMASVSDEFRPGLEDEILGDIAELLEVEEILRKASIEGVHRTKARIEDALKRAKDAANKQRELFSSMSSQDPNRSGEQFTLSPLYLERFVMGMLPRVGVTVERRSFGGIVLELVLPPNIVESLAVNRNRVSVTFDRQWGANRSDVVALNLESPLVKVLIARAKSYGFDGLTACIPNLPSGFTTTAILRWQNDQGQRIRQEFVSIDCDRDGSVRVNSEAFRRWLIDPATGGVDPISGQEARELFRIADSACQSRLEVVSNRDLHPENRQWVSSAWSTLRRDERST